ncbi:MAG: hypothetical protein ACMG6E_10425 [Candidatus Roizmanbacteria bacterium]
MISKQITQRTDQDCSAFLFGELSVCTSKPKASIPFPVLNHHQLFSASKPEVNPIGN